MSFKERRQRDKLRGSLKKLNRKGFRGYPIATIAYYGPDDRRASKVAVGIMRTEGDEEPILRRWFSEAGDVRSDDIINAEIVEFIQQHATRSVVERQNKVRIAQSIISPDERPLRGQVRRFCAENSSRSTRGFGAATRFPLME